MYEQISKDIFDVLKICRTGVQCETRYKTLAKRKRSEDKHNGTSGNSRCRVSYEEEFQAIRAIDDSLEPEVLRGVDKVTHKVSMLNSPKAGPSCATQEDELDSSEQSASPAGFDDAPAEQSASGGDRGSKKRKTDRGMRPSNTRMQHMLFFFEQMKKLNDEKEEKKAAREKQREQRHQELLQAHREQMEILKEIASKQ